MQRAQPSSGLPMRRPTRRSRRDRCVRPLRLGSPAGRPGAREGTGLLGSDCGLGQTIEDALQRGRTQRALRYSFEMLGEGARTAADAERYFGSYAPAIDGIAAGAGDIAGGPGI